MCVRTAEAVEGGREGGRKGGREGGRGCLLAFAVPQPVAIGVESHARDNDQIERREGEREGGREDGLGDAPFGEGEGGYVLGGGKGEHDHVG